MKCLNVYAFCLIYLWAALRMAPADNQLDVNINMCLPEPSAATVYTPACICRRGLCPKSKLTLVCNDSAEIPKNVTTTVGCL